jgi:hypothetical protein
MALAIVGLVPFPARAGDRPLEVLLANMSPAGVGPECMRDVQRLVRREETNITRIGGERVRELTGHEDDGSDFTRWRGDELDAVVRVVRAERIDAIVLVDCRPEEGRADVWVRAPSGGVAQLRLRRTLLDPARLEWLVRGIMFQAWQGFAP